MPVSEKRGIPLLHGNNATYVQGAEVPEVDPAPALVELHGGSGELIGEGWGEVIRVPDCVGHLPVRNVGAIARQDAWKCPC